MATVYIVAGRSEDSYSRVLEPYDTAAERDARHDTLKAEGWSINKIEWEVETYTDGRDFINHLAANVV